jgi:hypothetical protein
MCCLIRSTYPIREQNAASPPSVAILERKGLVEYILNYQPKRAPLNVEKVVQQLIELKQMKS